MKTIFLLLALMATTVNLQASYYEEWIIEGTISRVYTKEETAKILADRKNINIVGENYAGIQFKTTKCNLAAGHGATKWKDGIIQNIVVSFDPKLIKFTPAKHMRIKVRYSYSDSATPSGEHVENIWNLIAILPESDKAAQQGAP